MAMRKAKNVLTGFLYHVHQPFTTNPAMTTPFWMGKIYLVPFGEIEEGVLEHLVKTLPGVLGYETAKLLSRPYPGRSYDPFRRQYRGEAFLEALPQGGPDRYVGLVEADLYVPPLNFIFGLADRATGRAVVALPRLRQEFYGLRPDRERFLERVVKEVLHELGHTWQLGHCPNPLCVMHFSNSLADTDRKEPRYCPRCLAQMPFSLAAKKTA
ncbi:MAG TPA: hypothetical protein ENF44_05065 [Deltaproteobacteria bacterium]|nr:hypothetical protein [Deltaproteobacteria bacterium]